MKTGPRKMMFAAALFLTAIILSLPSQSLATSTSGSISIFNLTFSFGTETISWIDPDSNTSTQLSSSNAGATGFAPASDQKSGDFTVTNASIPSNPPSGPIQAVGSTTGPNSLSVNASGTANINAGQADFSSFAELLGTFTITGATTFTVNGQYDYSLTSDTTDGGTAIVNTILGFLTIDGTDLFNLASLTPGQGFWTGSIDLDDSFPHNFDLFAGIDATVTAPSTTPVPEPATLLLMGVGLLAAGYRARKGI